MRRLRVIGFLMVAAFFAACSPYPRESERSAEAMRQAEAVYGDGSLLIETDTALFVPGLAEASQYYAGKRQYGKAALAALYNGYTERDFDKEAAMVSFKEAERYGELAHDSLTMARAEYWMGRLLYYDGMTEEANKLLLQSETVFCVHPIERAMVLNNAACCYILLHEYDSANLLLEKSLYYAELGHSSILKNKVLNNYAVLYRLTECYNKALEYLRLVSPQNNEQLLLNGLNLGDIFMFMDVYDSADFYYQFIESLLFEDDIIPETKVAALGSLSRYAEKRGEFSRALYYSKLHDTEQSKIQQDALQKNVHYIQQKYDYESAMNTINKKLIHRRRMIVVLSIAVSLVLTAFGIAMLRMSKILKNELELKASLLQLTEQNLNLIGQGDSYKASLEKIVNELGQTKDKEQQVFLKLAVFLENPSDKSLLHALKHSVWDNDGFWAKAYKFFDSRHQGLRKELLRKYPNFSEQEQKVLVLSDLNASREDTSILLHISVHMVDKLRNNVRKKVSNLV